jgi:hypothetical protein
MAVHNPKVVIKSEEERFVLGEVYSPLHVDTDVEAMTPDEIRKMAHKFLASGRTNRIDVQHDLKESGCFVAESFVARKNDPDGFLAGSWVLGVYVLPDKLWAQVKKGELNGFSFFATKAKRVAATVEVEVARRMIGKTEMSVDNGFLPPHDHEVDLRFDENGRIVPGMTRENFGHKHDVSRATATDPALEHSHRLVLIENEE